MDVYGNQSTLSQALARTSIILTRIYPLPELPNDKRLAQRSILLLLLPPAPKPPSVYIPYLEPESTAFHLTGGSNSL